MRVFLTSPSNTAARKRSTTFLPSLRMVGPLFFGHLLGKLFGQREDAAADCALIRLQIPVVNEAADRRERSVVAPISKRYGAPTLVFSRLLRSLSQYVLGHIGELAFKKHPEFGDIRNVRVFLAWLVSTYCRHRGQRSFDLCVELCAEARGTERLKAHCSLAHVF